VAILPKKGPASKSVETLTHGEETRKNIPTAEHRYVLQEAEARSQ
jgi:hypothetical protein